MDSNIIPIGGMDFDGDYVPKDIAEMSKAEKISSLKRDFACMNILAIGYGRALSLSELLKEESLNDINM